MIWHWIESSSPQYQPVFGRLRSVSSASLAPGEWGNPVAISQPFSAASVTNRFCECTALRIIGADTDDEWVESVAMRRLISGGREANA